MPCIALMIDPFNTDAAIHAAFLHAGGIGLHPGGRGMGRDSGPTIITLSTIRAKLRPVKFIAVAIPVLKVPVLHKPDLDRTHVVELQPLDPKKPDDRHRKSSGLIVEGLRDGNLTLFT